MIKTFVLDDGRVVKVITGDSVKESISSSDAEMDRRTEEAVKAAIHRAKVCGKPVARYDKKREHILKCQTERKVCVFGSTCPNGRSLLLRKRTPKAAAPPSR